MIFFTPFVLQLLHAAHEDQIGVFQNSPNSFRTIIESITPKQFSRMQATFAMPFSLSKNYLTKLEYLHQLQPKPIKYSTNYSQQHAKSKAQLSEPITQPSRITNLLRRLSSIQSLPKNSTANINTRKHRLRFFENRQSNQKAPAHQSRLRD